VVEELLEAIERARQQPEDEQRRLARIILDELDDQEWEQSSALRVATAEAHAEIAGGDVMAYEDYVRTRRQRVR
jgi:hypothetical protein